MSRARATLALAALLLGVHALPTHAEELPRLGTVAVDSRRLDAG